MSCRVCKNRSSIVLMSFENRPMGKLLTWCAVTAGDKRETVRNGAGSKRVFELVAEYALHPAVNRRRMSAIGREAILIAWSSVAVLEPMTMHELHSESWLMLPPALPSRVLPRL